MREEPSLAEETDLAPPVDFATFRAELIARRERLPKRLAQAAQFALAHPDDIALGTAASIAAAAQVQPSTLVRLARHLGYDGFSDLQSVFRRRLKNRASSYEERLKAIEAGSAGSSYESALLNGFVTAARRSIEGLASTINEADFTRSVNVLANAETIYLIARRRSYPLVAHMGYAFAKLRIKAVMIDSPNGIDVDTAAMAGARDAAVICSFSPYASETLDIARMMAGNGVPVVAITDSALSPLAGLATHWLEVSENDFAGFRSLSASMALVMALPVAVAERRRYRL